ncbi:MAG: LysM peptidoglycan-binding domain-containing protein, partial [Porphyromonadaceae bacterium]|nr:LysM peptidoglycan-binding domain-containing protein [Porphyromonadaceae bacterium]
AVSPVGATGLWQFMIGTARMMGLEVNSVVDERRSPQKSTQQALRYLQQLYENFGDWTLAIAAYNCGPGNVNKAIRRSGGKRDYWAIYPYLPRETRGYVPAFISVNYVMNYYGEHNIQPGEMEMPSAIDTVVVTRRLHFKQIAEVLHVEMEDLRLLNPQYRRDVIPATGSHPYALVLPDTVAYAFAEEEDSIGNYQAEFYARRVTAELAQAANTPVQGYHRVKSGENLSVIAYRYHTTVANLKKWNNLKSNNIYPGMRLVVRSSAAKNSSSTAAKTTAKAQTKEGGGRYYTVKAGDSLWKISQKYAGLTVQALKNANSLTSNTLKVGQVLVIP